MMTSKKKVVVLGATGFIGRNIAEKLAKLPEYKVYGVFHNSEPYYNKNIEFIKADLREFADVNNVLNGKDIVIQAAATTSGSKDIRERPYLHVTDNAIMNSTILRTIIDHKVEQFIFTSCSVMYQSSESPLRERDFNASNEIKEQYFGVGWTKVYIEKMCEFYSRQSSTKFSVIRHSNIYGPHDKFDLEKSHVLGAMINKVMTCQSEHLDVWGDGSEGRDFLYIDDLVNFIVSVLKKQKDQFEIVNVGSGVLVTIKELVNKIIELSGKDIDIVYNPSNKGIHTKISLNCNQAKAKYGWRPDTSLTKGLQNTLSWFSSHYL